MLAESITKERKEILVREKAQQKVCLFKKRKNEYLRYIHKKHIRLALLVLFPLNM